MLEYASLCAPGPIPCGSLLPLLLLELGDDAPGSDHVRMLLRILLQQRVEIALQGIDSPVDFRNLPRRGGEHGFLPGNLSSHRIPGLFRLTQLQSGVVEARLQLLHSREIVRPRGGLPEVAQPEFLQPVLGLFELPFVKLDLLLDETLGLVGSEAAAALIGLDEHRRERLDHLPRPRRIRVAETHHVQVLPPGCGDLQALDEVLGQHVLRHLPVVQTRPDDQLLDVRTADQGPPQHRHLLIDVGLHRQSGHQGFQDRLGVNENPRLRLEVLRHARDDEHPDQGNRPRRCEPQPAPRPHATNCDGQVAKDLIHGTQAALSDGRYARSRSPGACRPHCDALEFGNPPA